MFDMSWGEIMVIGGVALIVIGPKDLPKALRTVGQMTTKVRRMAGEFQSQFSEAMREAELDDVRKEVEGLNRDVSTATSTAFNPLQTIRDEIKGSIEAKPSTASGSGEWTPGQAEVTAGPLVEPLPPEPSSAASGPAPIAHIDPEAQPLIPLPVDEPVLPPPEPAAAIDGSGPMQLGDPAMPREARA